MAKDCDDRRNVLWLPRTWIWCAVSWAQVFIVLARVFIASSCFMEFESHNIGCKSYVLRRQYRIWCNLFATINGEWLNNSSSSRYWFPLYEYWAIESIRQGVNWVTYASWMATTLFSILVYSNRHNLNLFLLSQFDWFIHNKNGKIAENSKFLLCTSSISSYWCTQQVVTSIST